MRPRAEMTRPLVLTDVAIKALYLALSLFVALNPQAQQFAGKAMWPRLVAYPLGVLLIPIVWTIFSRNRIDTPPYPALADILLTLPFVTDLAGNVFDLFDTIEVYDDVMHFLNWCLLSAAFGVLLLRVRIGPIAAAGLTLGFGAITAILWEGIEWLTFIRFGTELATAYEDTLLDEHLGLLGSAVAALLVLRAKRRANRRRLLESG
jgi:hypothetical protein